MSNVQIRHRASSRPDPRRRRHVFTLSRSGRHRVRAGAVVAMLAGALDGCGVRLERLVDVVVDH
jgi:hypothetical protein